MKKPRVHVLLSIYNGERFLAEQLDSIERQTYQPLRVFMRDDGSGDASAAIARKYCVKNGWHFERGVNQGVFNSYFQLLRTAGDADYVAFADQDDWWLSCKIERAVERLRSCAPVSVPALYFSGTQSVSHNAGRRAPNPGAGWRGALFENQAPGCAIVMNRKAREILSAAHPRGILLHDWWSYLVISILGKVAYDPAPTVVRREHGANASYFDKSRVARLRGRIRRFAGGDNGVDHIVHQASEFLRFYGDMAPPTACEYIRALTSIRESRGMRRIRAVAGLPIARDKWIDRTLIRLLLLCGAARIGMRKGGYGRIA